MLQNGAVAPNRNRDGFQHVWVKPSKSGDEGLFSLGVELCFRAKNTVGRIRHNKTFEKYDNQGPRRGVFGILFLTFREEQTVYFFLTKLNRDDCFYNINNAEASRLYPEEKKQ